jgi:hypothetical protein
MFGLIGMVMVGYWVYRTLAQAIVIGILEPMIKKEELRQECLKEMRKKN